MEGLDGGIIPAGDVVGVGVGKVHPGVVSRFRPSHRAVIRAKSPRVMFRSGAKVVLLTPWRMPSSLSRPV